MGMTLKERIDHAKIREGRILKFITQDPPMPLANIVMVEGISTGSARKIIKKLSKEHGISYIGTAASRNDGGTPVGLTETTNRFRSSLANELWRVTNNHNEFGFKARVQAASALGLHPREQIAAEVTPFNHDWKLSQIERLARQLGEDPREFLLKCLTT